jgi:hypothetical protein
MRHPIREIQVWELLVSLAFEFELLFDISDCDNHTVMPPLVGGVPVTFDETDRLSEIESP